MIHETSAFIFVVPLQDGVTEDDIDDSFKSMFAQLAGEVSSVFLFGIFVCICTCKIDLNNFYMMLVVVILWYFFM